MIEKSQDLKFLYYLFQVIIRKAIFYIQREYTVRRKALTSFYECSRRRKESRASFTVRDTPRDIIVVR